MTNENSIYIIGTAFGTALGAIIYGLLLKLLIQSIILIWAYSFLAKLAFDLIAKLAKRWKES